MKLTTLVLSLLASVSVMAADPVTAPETATTDASAEGAIKAPTTEQKHEVKKAEKKVKKHKKHAAKKKKHKKKKHSA